MPSRPLVVFDTNLLVDILPGRDPGAGLLVALAEQSQIELVVPEYVLLEFRGTSLRWLREQDERLGRLRQIANEWVRAGELGVGPREIADRAHQIEKDLKRLPPQVDVLSERLKNVARIVAHTTALQFRGDLRFLARRPPQRGDEGLGDCRIFESVLALAADDANSVRPRYLVTSDSDFDAPELRAELTSVGFDLEKPGRLYGLLAQLT